MFQRGKQVWRMACARCAGGLLCSALLVGCSFGGAADTVAPNTCKLPTDCPIDLECQAGVCVMPEPEALDVTLEVTPNRMPDGSQPFPILYGPFPLQGGRRNFMLAVPTPVIGTVRRGSELINAQLTFVPTKAPASLAKPIQARTSLIKLSNAFSVLLLSGREYRVTVQPTEAAAVPAYTTIFTATPDERLDIDYGTLPSSVQNYWIKNLPTLPEGYKLRLKARAKDTNQVISNTAELGEGGRTLLMFAHETPPPYKLEIVVEKSFGSGQLSTLDACETSMPLVPTFSVDDSALKREASTKAQGAYDLTVELPKLPAAIPYAGTIQLCPPGKSPENLLVSLRSSALAISNMPQGISASFSVSVSAESEGSMPPRFCTRVLPGEYVVLVTPPAKLTCEIFAERRQILAATDEPDALDLRVPAKLNGKIVDNNMAPMANATIDAIALGIDTTDMLAENDPTVPIYNRSRQTSSDSNGSFALDVDVGVYDLIVKPPMQSGYGWQIRPSLNVGGARREDFATRVELAAPSLVEGSLRYGESNANRSSLAGADVHAYTVEGEGTPNARAVEIGHTVADDEGNVMLLISPVPRTSW